MVQSGAFDRGSRLGRVRTFGSRIILAAASLLMITACDDEPMGVDPIEQPPFDVEGQAFRVRVDVATGQISVVKPFSNSLRTKDGGASLSLIGQDGVELTAENYTSRSVFGVTYVTFDVTITNKFHSVDLVTSTFPIPPAGVEGVLLFPFKATPTAGDLKERITASPDWNGVGTLGSGEPHNFFNAGTCGRNEDDCYRWEAYPAPIVAGGYSAPQRVGFYFSSRVTSFEAVLVVAADLDDQVERPWGTILGTVTSAARGPLANMGVRVDAGAFTGITSANGAYSISNISSGPRTASLTTMPRGCAYAGPQTIRLDRGTTRTIDFALDCTTIDLIANAGGDVDAARGSTVTLDGAASVETADDPVSWTWTQVSGPDVTGGVGHLVGPSPTFTAPAAVTSLEFDLRLSDGFITGAPDRVQVNVMDDPTAALFVAPGGSDENPGTRALPKASIQAAIAAASGLGTGADVYVGAGAYGESLTLASGVSIYGGFDPDSWRRDPSTYSVTISGGPTAVRGSGVQNVALEALTVRSADATAPSTSSYGILLDGSSSIAIVNSVIAAGRGAIGEAGAMGASGTPGQPGQPGGPGRIDGCCEGGGGAGGSGPGPRGGNGGNGGREGDNDGAPGAWGWGPSGGSPGGGGWAEENWIGHDGGHGGAGGHGIGGMNGAAAVGFGGITPNGFVPLVGANGTTGSSGSGGGGGGGGGGQGGFFVDDGSGAGGGGGGAGGLGGGGGFAARGGGGSFALFIVSSTGIEVRDSRLTTAGGGRGGAGGRGGYGGGGGAGGAGGCCGGEVGAGGNGGAGGLGGFGGHGANGNGGHSIGVVEDAGSAVVLTNTSIETGPAGLGAPSFYGPPGYPNVPSQFENVPYFPPRQVAGNAGERANQKKLQ